MDLAVLPHMRMLAHTRIGRPMHTRMGYPIRVWDIALPHTRMGVRYEYIHAI